MASMKSIFLGFFVVAAIAGGAAFAVTNYGSSLPSSAQPAPAVPKAEWTATAPGRIEPKGGEVRLSSLMAARVADVAVSVNDQVRAGDLLLTLDDDDLRARLNAAEAEVAVRRRDRDAETTPRPALDRRQSEDAVAAAERVLLNQRFDLDRMIKQRRAGTAGVTDETVTAQRTAVAAATDKVEQERAVHRRNQTAANMPQQTRVEAAVTAARADVQLAMAALERTRLRAPSDGTVLQVQVRMGELASASPEQTLIVMGDLSALRVRAEVEERDLAKVAVGQAVTVKTDAYPGRNFAGTVASLAQSLSPGRIAQKGPRRPNDHDTLEVQINLEPGTPLLPGMRVDVFFKADQTPKSADATPTK